MTAACSEPAAIDRPSALIPASVARFNAMQGKLRVSVTHSCQLRCRFCHQEGIDRHWASVHMSPAYFGTLLSTFTELGGLYVELTGGEPLMHPYFARLLRDASVYRRHICVHTNGLRLDTIISELESGYVQLLKCSLHMFDDTRAAKRLLGTAWDFSSVSKNLASAVRTGTRVQLLYTVTEQNIDALPHVLDFALRLRTDVQLVDLIPSRKKNMLPMLGYVGGAVLEAAVQERAEFDQIISDRTGATLRVYRTPHGAIWEIKDVHYGLLHTRMCDGCPLIASCGEGIYALRVDALGRFKPCLLRQDLDVQTAPEQCDRIALKKAMIQLVSMMMGGHAPELDERL